MLDSGRNDNKRKRPFDVEDDRGSKGVWLDDTAGSSKRVCIDAVPREKHVERLMEAAEAGRLADVCALVQGAHKTETRDALCELVDDPNAVVLICTAAHALGVMPTVSDALDCAAIDRYMTSIETLITHSDHMDDIWDAIEWLVTRDYGDAVDLLMVVCRRHPLVPQTLRDAWAYKALHKAATTGRLQVVEKIADLCPANRLHDVLLACGGRQHDGRAFKTIWKYADLCVHRVAFELVDGPAAAFLRDKIADIGRTCDAPRCMIKELDARRLWRPRAFKPICDAKAQGAVAYSPHPTHVACPRVV